MRIKKIYKKSRTLAGKICNQFYYLGLIRNVILRIEAGVLGWASHYKNYSKNLKVAKNLRDIIALAKKNKQPIFIQFPIIPWSRSLFQRPQQIAKAMSEMGYLTVYLSQVDSKKYALQQIAPNFYISNVYDVLKDLSASNVSVYLNYPASENLERYLTKRFFRENTVFCEHVDHIDEQIHGKYFAKALEQRFKDIKKQNFSFLIGTSNTLCEELNASYPSKSVAYIPNGVDPSHYETNKKDQRNIALPHKLKKAIEQKKKIIGFFGAIAPWIWNELVVEIAKKRPNYLIMMIGPESGGVLPFPRMSNICLTGSVNYNHLPFYANHFDVSIIPFRLGELAKATSPLKLFEYFAIGKPIVVTSDLLECTKFDGVASASNAEEFTKQIDLAMELGNNNEELKAKYKQYAESNSWVGRARQIIRTIDSSSYNQK